MKVFAASEFRVFSAQSLNGELICPLMTSVGLISFRVLCIFSGFVFMTRQLKDLRLGITVSPPCHRVIISFPMVSGVLGYP